MTNASPTSHAIRKESLSHHLQLNLKLNLWMLLAHPLSEKTTQKKKPHFAQQSQPCIRCLKSNSPSIFPSGSSMRQPSMSCLSVPEEHAWPAAQPRATVHFPVPGTYVPGNLWSISTLEWDIPGPLGSFLRHTTAMQSQNVPNYVTTQKYPVRGGSFVWRIQHLRSSGAVRSLAGMWSSYRLSSNSCHLPW